MKTVTERERNTDHVNGWTEQIEADLPVIIRRDFIDAREEVGFVATARGYSSANRQ